MRLLPPLLAVVLAGCLGAVEQPLAPSWKASGVEALAPGPAVATLEAPPAWGTGTWWRVEADAAFFERPVVSTRVVVGVADGKYVVGFPPDEWGQADSLITAHLPGFGEVGREDLSFGVHNKLFAPVRFPLVEGATWETTFEGLPLDALVEEVEGPIARIRYTGPFGGNATYDARIGELSSLTIDGYMTVTVLEHGTGYDGSVVWPRGQDFLWKNFGRGRWIGVFDQDGRVSGPVETLPVNDTFDRLSANFAIGATGWPVSAPGYFRERATAPDGTVYEYTVSPQDGAWFGFPVFGHDDPGGVWTLEHYAVGIGIAGIEVVAYEVVEVDLATGEVRERTRP